MIVIVIVIVTIIVLVIVIVLVMDLEEARGLVEVREGGVVVEDLDRVLIIIIKFILLLLFNLQ